MVNEERKPWNEEQRSIFDYECSTLAYERKRWLGSEWEPINERMILARLRTKREEIYDGPVLRRRPTFTVSVIRKIPKGDIQIHLDDFNAKIGSENEDLEQARDATDCDRWAITGSLYAPKSHWPCPKRWVPNEIELVKSWRGGPDSTKLGANRVPCRVLWQPQHAHSWITLPPSFSTQGHLGLSR